MKDYKGFIPKYENEELIFINKHTGRRVVPYNGSDGYSHITRQEFGKKIRERTHRIVEMCLVDNPNGYKYLDHKNNNRLDYRPENLEWCSNSYNVKKRIDSDEPIHAKNTAVNIYEYGRLIMTCNSLRQIQDNLHISRHRGARILKGEVENNYKYEFEYA